ncbi:MAG: glycosyltransferase family 2 protein [Candidatus Omnitrophica bacterium]|nr:glycosyltransferase family 2 protein [Candidatus Omnitrophota bacterium]
MKLSVIIPAYNEKDTVLAIIDKVISLPIEKEIIVVDDGSTDGTREVLLEIEKSKVKNQNFKIIFKGKNEGKGAAIRKGLEYATGDYVIFQDADTELEPSDITTMFKLVNNSENKVVYGSRFLKKHSLPLINLLANKFLTFLTNILFGSRITDMETCYKLCPRELLSALNLTANGFEIEPEITCKILKKGYKIKEIPINYNPRRKGKKINWKDGVKAIFYIFKYRITE